MTDNNCCPTFGSCHRNLTSTAKLIYSWHPVLHIVALERKLVVAFLFSESEVIDALYANQK